MPTLTVNAKRARKTVVNEIALLVESAQDKNKSSSGDMDIINKNIDIYPWLTKSSVYGCLRRIKMPIPQKISSQNIVVDSSTSIVPFDPFPPNELSGRPKGSTILNAATTKDDLNTMGNKIPFYIQMGDMKMETN